MLSKLLYNKGYKPERCDCKHKFHEMKEAIADNTAEHMVKFVKESKKFRGGY